MDPNELDLVPIDELKAAFLRRFDCALIAAFYPADGGEAVTWGWRGDAYRVVGLMEDLKVRLFAKHEAAR